MDESPLATLPDELLEAIVFYLPPKDTLAFGATCRATNKITYEPLIWRRHCLETWRYWDARHELKEKTANPPAQTRWRLLFEERHKADKRAQVLLDELLLTQQFRLQRLEDIAQIGYDVKDLFLRIREHTPKHVEDVLARTYHADVILGRIHRVTALEKWTRLQKSQMVRLEEVLGAYDLFVLSGNRGDLSDIERELDRHAEAIRSRDIDFDSFSTRIKATQVAEYLREHNLVGNEVTSFHALCNNFIGIALFTEPHTSLPLQSVAIYCAVARRLGVDAKPSNYPGHVHAVVKPPQGLTLDGTPKISTAADPGPDDPLEAMHMDPYRTSSEVPYTHLALRLTQMGAPQAQLAYHLRPTTSLEMALRTGRNIMNSVQEARDLQRNGQITYPDIESAWYSMLWSMMVLGDSSAATTLHRRRQCLPYLIEHHQAHFPEDLGLLENIVAPMFLNEREHEVLIDLITSTRAADQNKKAPNRRTATKDGVDLLAHKIGTHFKHKRFGYDGIVIGWDPKCGAEQQWIQQMRVDELPRGREQPFYNVVADDKSIRYVAEENIQPVFNETPCDALMGLAGRYFKRWDAENGLFVSNITDEYPDD